MSFDPENRLASVSSGGAQLLQAAYGAGNLRVWKSASGATTYYLYDDDNHAICEYNSSGVLQATNTYAPQGLGLISRQSDGVSTLYVFDPQGSVVQRLDGSGNVVNSSGFDAFGDENCRGPTSADPFAYGAQRGYICDPESGLQLLTYRYYSPSNGRFFTRDPIGAAGGINIYTYTENGPLVHSDPTGLTLFLCIRPIALPGTMCPLPGSGGSTEHWFLTDIGGPGCGGAKLMGWGSWPHIFSLRKLRAIRPAGHTLRTAGREPATRGLCLRQLQRRSKRRNHVRLSVE